MVDKADENRMSDALKQFPKSFNEIVELRLYDGREVTLVRPAGYVAFTADSINDSTLVSLRSLLERQTTNFRDR